MKAEKKDSTKPSGKQDKNQKNTPDGNHSSQGHATDTTGSATGSDEPTLRSSTTDSSRAAKNDNDDLPTGGNVR